MIATACLLLAAGCVGEQPVTDNTTDPATHPISRSEELVNTTDYIKMDADVYNVGEIVEFYMVNQGSEPLPCYNSPITFRVYRHNENNTWDLQPEPQETVTDYLVYMKPGEKTRVFRLITTNWTPGRYKIASVCRVSREFEIREIPKVTPA
jgi:hypothetical protein